jgi:hypothetical protein
MPPSEADAIIDAGYRAMWEERCWQKWLSENGAEKSYIDYEREFFEAKSTPDLNKSLEVAREIKRREEEAKK